jgi:hypothetical protein
MQVIKQFLIWSCIALFAGNALAQVQQAKGKASVTYQGWSASADDKAKATMAAQLKAIEFYYAEAGQSEAENFDAIREKIIAAPDRYILDSTILAEEENKDKKQYTVTVRVALNVANLRNAVKSNSAVVKAGPAARRHWPSCLSRARWKAPVVLTTASTSAWTRRPTSRPMPRFRKGLGR